MVEDVFVMITGPQLLALLEAVEDGGWTAQEIMIEFLASRIEDEADVMRSDDDD
jgi:hypothetical protein